MPAQPSRSDQTLPTAIRRGVGAALLVALITATTTAGAEPAVPSFAARLVAAAEARINRAVLYDPAYVRLAYPGGDVADDRGVCTDVVVRAFRALGIDLQRRVHEDMRRAFRAYPKRWGLRRPDPNIDHRRVPNLRRFFIRHGRSLPVSAQAADYRPGDLVTWDVARPTLDGQPRLGGGTPRRPRFAQRPHIGIVTARRSADGARPLIVHNIGAGTRLDDILFAFEVTGHYRFGG